jgi:predicted tellurium resistance membrane protein TerC
VTPFLVGNYGCAGAAQTVWDLPSGATQIIIAEVSMSDNVLAVAGTARDHVWVLIIGLALSVAADGPRRHLHRQAPEALPWISYIGLALIAYVAIKMIWDGAWEVWHATLATGVM